MRLATCGFDSLALLRPCRDGDTHDTMPDDSDNTHDAPDSEPSFGSPEAMERVAQQRSTDIQQSTDASPESGPKTDASSDPNANIETDGDLLEQVASEYDVDPDDLAPPTQDDEISEASQSVMDDLVEDGVAEPLAEDDPLAEGASGKGIPLEETNLEKPGDVLDSDSGNADEAAAETMADPPVPPGESDATDSGDDSTSGTDSRQSQAWQEYQRRREESDQSKEEAFGLDDGPDDDGPTKTAEDLALSEGGPDLSNWSEAAVFTDEIRGHDVTFQEPEDEDQIVDAIKSCNDSSDMTELRKEIACVVVAKIDGHPVDDAIPGGQSLRDLWPNFSPAIKMRVGNKAIDLTGVMDFTARSGDGQTAQ